MRIVSDATILLRDIAGDAATKTANKVNPSEDQLSQIDHPAEDNVWHDKPDLSRDNLKNQARSKMPIGKKDVQDAAGDATQEAHPSGSRDPTEAADLAARDQQQGTDSGVDAASGAKAGGRALKDKVSDGTDDDQKQKAREYRERTNEYFKNKLPKERREQIVYRLKKMVVEIQGHSDCEYRACLHRFGNHSDFVIQTNKPLTPCYAWQRSTLATLRTSPARRQEPSKVPTSRIPSKSRKLTSRYDLDFMKNSQPMLTDLKTLLERFANGTSFDDLFDSINQIYSDADRDPELKDWFKSMDTYVRKCLKEQGYILQDDSNEQWNRLYDHGNYLLRDRYRNHTDRIMDEVKFIAGEFDNDPQNTAFAQSMNKLFNDLGHDENGQMTFKPHLIKDLTEVILPGFFEHVRYVPIPRIEYTDNMVDAVIENLVIEGDNLAPNMFEFGSDNYWRWGRKSFTNKSKNKVMLSVSGIQMDLRDVSYYLKKKEGFPSISDKGLMDIFMGGSGLSFKVAMETADKSDNAHFFKINTVVVDVKNLSIKLKQSNHKLLFALFKPLLLKVMRPVIQKVAEKQIKDNVQKLDAMAFQIKKEADRAQEEAKNNPDPEHLQNMYQRYFTAAQQQLQKANQKKEQAKEATADKKVNIAITQHDSMFKNISLPGGISTKATEYKELAMKGDKWESPVFSIGSAGESKSIPSAGQPKRKQHNVTEGGVRGNRGLDNEGMSEQIPSSNGNALGSSGTSQGGFANQVDNAFQGDAPGSNGSAGTTGLDGTSGGQNAQQGTTLGSHNPVFQGQA